MSNEIRKDYLLDKWVIIATERAKRPSDFKPVTHEIDKKAACPFCAGNEDMTPPARALYIPTNGKIIVDMDKERQKRRSDWIIRVFANLYPALKPIGAPSVFEDDFLLKINGFGDHEVLVETPNHHEQLHIMNDEEVKLVFMAYRDRFRELSLMDKIRYVSIFRNYGAEAGASLSHPHSQIIALPVLPPTIRQELDKLEFDGSRCKFDEIIEHERDSERLILERDHVIAFAPFASVSPFEVWIFVKRHVHNILNLREEELTELAITTRDILSAISKLLSDPPYNYAFWQTISEKEYHMNIRIFPRLSIHAGFEYNTLMFINSVPPEHAAKYLREALES